MHRTLFILPAIALFTSVGCGEEMSALQAAGALGESSRSARGIEATQEPIEVSTEFTIGGAHEDAAAELRGFWESQAPCNTLTHEGSTVSIDWGELNDGCTWNGRTYAGLTEIQVTHTEAEALEVEHTWIGFHNEDVQVDGGAVVTWSAADLTRHVSTEHTWSQGDEQVDVEGEHEFGVRDDAFSLDGKRVWTTEGKTWDLAMSGIEFRLQDPVPEAGSYTITDPEGRILDIAFDRIDDSTIEAVLSGVRGGDVVYHVTGRGEYERVDGAQLANR